MKYKGRYIEDLIILRCWIKGQGCKTLFNFVEEFHAIESNEILHKENYNN